VSDPGRQDLDPLLLSSELRRLACEMRPLLGEAGMVFRLRDDSAFRGEGYTEIFFADIRDILEQLNR